MAASRTVRARIVPAEWAHIPAIVAGVRQADIDELWASSFSTVEGAIERGLRASTAAWTVLYDGAPVTIAGVAPLSILGAVGVPWLVGTAAVERAPVPFLRASRGYVPRMLGLYHHLVNYVDNRNTTAIRYLRWLGFQMGEPTPHGVLGLPFRRFEMRAHPERAAHV